MNQWAVSSVLLASSRERGWAQWNTHDALASGGTPCFYRCTYFYRTSQGEASTEGSKQTIWVPVSLNFGGRWRNPSSEGGGERHALLPGEQELLSPASSLPGNPEGVQMPDLNKLLVFKASTTWTPCCQLSASRLGPVSAEVVKLRPTGHV